MKPPPGIRYRRAKKPREYYRSQERTFGTEEVRHSITGAEIISKCQNVGSSVVRRIITRRVCMSLPCAQIGHY